MRPPIYIILPLLFNTAHAIDNMQLSLDEEDSQQDWADSQGDDTQTATHQQIQPADNVPISDDLLLELTYYDDESEELTQDYSEQTLAEFAKIGLEKPTLKTYPLPQKTIAHKAQISTATELKPWDFTLAQSAGTATLAILTVLITGKILALLCQGIKNHFNKRNNQKHTDETHSHEPTPPL